MAAAIESPDENDGTMTLFERLLSLLEFWSQLLPSRKAFRTKARCGCSGFQRLHPTGLTSVIPSFDKVRLQMECGVVVAQRKRDLTGRDLGAAPIEVGPGIRRVENELKITRS